MNRITEGKNKQTVIESLRDRIVGRYLAEDILDNDGNICYHINDYVTEDMADQISSLREKVKTVPYSIAKPKSAFAVNVMAVIWLQVEKLKLAKLLVLLLLNPLVNLVLSSLCVRSTPVA